MTDRNIDYGLQSINALDFALAPYVAKSFKKALWNKYKEWLYFEGCKVNENNENSFNSIDFKLLHYTEDRNCSISISAISDDYSSEHDFDISADDYIDRCLDIGETAASKIYDLACQDVEEETKQAMEALIHNFNSLHSRAGSQVKIRGLKVW